MSRGKTWRDAALEFRPAALFGGTLLGVVGALLAILSAAAIQIAIREYMDHRRAYGPV